MLNHTTHSSSWRATSMTLPSSGSGSTTSNDVRTVHRVSRSFIRSDSPAHSYLFSWSLTSLFSTNTYIRDDPAHSLQQQLLSCYEASRSVTTHFKKQMSYPDKFGITDVTFLLPNWCDTIALFQFAHVYLLELYSVHTKVKP